MLTLLCFFDRYIDAGDLKIAFYLKSPLYLVATSDWGEPESVVSIFFQYEVEMRFWMCKAEAPSVYPVASAPPASGISLPPGSQRGHSLATASDIPAAVQL